jgi:hypothetical protein
MRWLVACALLAGCYDTGTVECGALLCPHGNVCAPEEDRCVAPNQVTACAGQAEGAGCTAGTITGLCHKQVCIEAGCGNGVIESLVPMPDIGQAKLLGVWSAGPARTFLVGEYGTILY